MLTPSELLKMHREPSANVQKATFKDDKPTLRFSGKVVPPEHPAYEIIKRLILNRYRTGSGM
jgi:hypothetical protein